MPSVLLIEDHAMVRRLLIRVLTERGNVEIWDTAITAEAALELLANPENNSLPDLVMADVSLPGMSGIQLVVELKALYPDLPCLLVSANYYGDSVQKALTNGARGYVIKGNPAAIVEGVHRVLAGEIYLSAEVRHMLKE
jgi:DNA-binding NarL/FixJ family response regulator